MTPSPEFDAFVISVAKFSKEIGTHSINSWRGIDLSADEPTIVKRYLLDPSVGVDYLNKNLAPILSHASYQVKFASVFVHKKPRVTRTAASKKICNGSTEGCELGDLLIVFCLLDKNKKPLYTSAVISQVKKTKSMPSGSQQCLYDRDLTFLMPKRVYEASIIATDERHLPDYSAGRSKALNYLILEENPFILAVPWSAGLAHNFAFFFNRIILGDLGLPFGSNVTKPDWNCIIHDLLNIGNGIIPSRIRRGSGMMDLVNLFNDFDDYRDFSVEIQDQVGLPILFIIVQDTEYKRPE